jgi:hypothetical protein
MKGRGIPLPCVENDDLAVELIDQPVEGLDAPPRFDDVARGADLINSQSSYPSVSDPSKNHERNGPIHQGSGHRPNVDPAGREGRSGSHLAKSEQLDRGRLVDGGPPVVGTYTASREEPGGIVASAQHQLVDVFVERADRKRAH